MQIAIDIGNTHVKVGFFRSIRPYKTHLCSTDQELLGLLQSYSSPIVYSTVRKLSPVLLENLTQRSATQLSISSAHLPIRIDYTSPETLGTDRLAAAIGAYLLYPSRNTLIIDTGTCFTYTLLTQDGVLTGGLISPGIDMRLRALKEYTFSLPSLTLSTPVSHNLIGKNTKECIQIGVWRGAEAELKGVSSDFAKHYSHLQVLLCGGSACALQKSLKVTNFVEQDLSLIGLRHMLHRQSHA